MEALAGLDDCLLLAESEQGAHLAEEVAADISRAAPSLPCECLEGVAPVVAAIDRKVGAVRHWNTNRLR
jgi:hypothetical protein